jgi:polyisoprenoid-binding protein YceI
MNCRRSLELTTASVSSSGSAVKRSDAWMVLNDDLLALGDRDAPAVLGKCCPKLPARVDPELRERGLTTVVGRFSRFDGQYAVRDGGRSIELTIDADSLDTHDRRRDEHLRSADFFDVERHPYVRFDANDVTDLEDGKLAVVGELEAAGMKVTFSFEATFSEVGDDLEIEATTIVDHRLLGMTWSPLGTLRAPATLHVQARLTPNGVARTAPVTAGYSG